jgi:hypothetical protein
MRRLDRVLTVSVVAACLGCRLADGADAAPPPPTEVKPAKAPPSRSETYAPRLLECGPPADCPIPRSRLVDRVMLTGRHVRHGASDNVYPAWAEDGTAYSGFADGGGTGKEVGQGLCQLTGCTRAIERSALAPQPRSAAGRTIQAADRNVRDVCGGL